MLRKLRLERLPGLQQQEVVRRLAELSGFRLSKQNYSAMEYGRRPVPDGIIAAATQLYGVAPSTFKEYWWRRVARPEACDPELLELVAPLVERSDWPELRTDLLNALRPTVEELGRREPSR